MTVARYHEALYGSPLLYGQGTPTGLLSWKMLVDWDNDGVFDGSNENQYMVAFESFRGRRKMIKKYGTGFEVLAPGKFSFTVRNDDGRYDEFNTASPLYPHVTTGLDVKIVIRNQETGQDYDVIYGIIEDIVPDYYRNDRVAQFYCVETTSYLQKAAARVPVSSNTYLHTAIDNILTYANWPVRWGRLLDTSADQIPYTWSRSQEQAFGECLALAEAYLGYFFSDRAGRARFVSRAAIGSSVADFESSHLLQDIGNNNLYDNFRNIVRIKCHPRTAQTSGVIYELLGNKPSLLAGQMEEIVGDYNYGGTACPAINVIPPVAGAANDYAFNTLPDGSGTDKTAQVAVFFTPYGDSFRFQMTNNDAGTVYCTKLQVRGQAVTEDDTHEITYPLDISTVSNPRELSMDSVWMQDINIARNLLNVFGLFISSRHPTPTIILESRPELQFIPDLFDIVTLTIPAISINGNSFRVSGIEHRTLTDNCQSVRTTLSLEPYISGELFLTWPVTDFGTDTVFGW